MGTNKVGSPDSDIAIEIAVVAVLSEEDLLEAVFPFRNEIYPTKLTTDLVVGENLGLVIQPADGPVRVMVSWQALQRGISKVLVRAAKKQYKEALDDSSAGRLAISEQEAHITDYVEEVHGSGSLRVSCVVCFYLRNGGN